jgi:hypothetical protein
MGSSVDVVWFLKAGLRGVFDASPSGNRQCASQLGCIALSPVVLAADRLLYMSTLVSVGSELITK